jgi:hypothetical protein
LDEITAFSKSTVKSREIRREGVDMNNYRWLSMIGKYENDGSKIKFIGEEIDGQNGERYLMIGNYICDQSFTEGKISAKVEFISVENDCSCDLILYYSNVNNELEMVTVGIDKNMYNLFEFKSIKGGKWTTYQACGNPNSLKSNQIYEIELEYIGSIVKFRVNGIEVINSRLPFSKPKSQVGLWNRGNSEIIIHEYSISSIRPKAFVVMQFGEHYNDLYNDVIRPICTEFCFDVIRADDIYNNGMIVNDITNSLKEAKIIIADITPKNPNVYYEVGYAHALNKNTILLAEEGVELPFDVRPYRTIFYKNSISGKKMVEERLRMHLNEII